MSQPIPPTPTEADELQRLRQEEAERRRRVQEQLDNQRQVDDEEG